MYEESKKAREAMKTKAKRLVAGDPREKVDSSTWSPPEAELADVKTGARPLVKRLYKKGGKVVGKSEGKEANKHGGRMPRKSGGKTTHKAPWIDDLINRDVRMANDEREGEKHDGAFKKGGKAKRRADGGPTTSDLDRDLGVTTGNYFKPKGQAPQSPAYNEQAVNKAISSSRQKIGGKEAKAIHSLLKGPYKEGGKAKKFGGGPIGSNPVGQQNEMMGKAAGMRKRGGRAKYATDGMVPGTNPEGQDQIKKMIQNDDGFRMGAPGRGIPTDQPPVFKKSAPMVDPDIHPGKKPPTADKMGAKKGGKIKHQHIDKADELADKDLIKSMVKSNALQHKKHGGEVHHASCTCHKCGGGRTMKYAGGGVFSGNSKEKIPGAEGGRKARYLGGPLMNNPMGGAMGTGAPPMGMQAAAQPAPVMGAGMGMGNYPMPRKAGGRTKGKTQVNIVIGAHPAQPAGNAPNMPVMPPRPPMGVPVPPPSMAGGAPMMPPGGPQMPPPGMMPRKSGGRTNYPIDSGAGGANARLEKIDAYGLKPPRKK